jgi:hypothetical protein
MIAAIYARKSTDQHLPDAEKSVTRQIEHATAYAAKKGWTVARTHIYSDDGISGAEFDRRAGLPCSRRAARDPRSTSSSWRAVPAGPRGDRDGVHAETDHRRGRRGLVLPRRSSGRHGLRARQGHGLAVGIRVRIGAGTGARAPTTRWPGRRRRAMSRVASCTGTRTSASTAMSSVGSWNPRPSRSDASSRSTRAGRASGRSQRR